MSRLESFRNKARSFTGRLSAGGGGGGGSGPLSARLGGGSGPTPGGRRSVSGPLSLSSARGKGGGFFSMTIKSPERGEIPAGGGGAGKLTGGGEREAIAIAEGATLSPDSFGSEDGTGSGGDGPLKVADDVFMAVGKRPFAAPPSPGTE